MLYVGTSWHSIGTRNCIKVNNCVVVVVVVVGVVVVVVVVVVVQTTLRQKWPAAFPIYCGR